MIKAVLLQFVADWFQMVVTPAEAAEPSAEKGTGMCLKVVDTYRRAAARILGRTRGRC